MRPETRFVGIPMGAAAVLAASLALASCAWLGGAGHKEQAVPAPVQRSLKRSDVVFMGPAAAETYDHYGATVVSWGGRPWSFSDYAVDDYRRRVRIARLRGIRYDGGVAFRTAFAGMIDFDPGFMGSVCRTLDGEPITVPWLWDQHYKGHPAYWFCTNSPRYRAFLKHQVDLVSAGGVDGLQIDDYGGTAGAQWQGGCFCPYCMEGFRRYLESEVPAEVLLEQGITDLTDFDYGQFLRDKGVTREEFRKYFEWYPARIPLAQQYIAFQYRATAQWVAEYKTYAEAKIGHRLPLSVNASLSDPKDLFIAPVVDYYCGEVAHDASKQKPADGPIFTYKLGDAIGRPVACTAMGWDWAFVIDKDCPGLVRTWIAQAYAFGHQFMAPTRQWAYTEEQGTHWYYSKPGDYDFLYRFVRENAGLLDGYDAVADVGVLYSNRAFRAWKRQARDVCTALTLDNVPCRLVLAGDDWLPARLSRADADRLRALVVAEPTFLDPEQGAVLAALSEKVVAWPDEGRLAELSPRQIAVTGAEGVVVVPRAKAGDAGAPFVCHLLNRSYRAETDDMAVPRDFTVTLSDSLFGARITGAVLHAPGAAPRRLDVVEREGGVDVKVPELGVWAILELAH